MRRNLHLSWTGPSENYVPLLAEITQQFSDEETMVEPVLIADNILSMAPPEAIIKVKKAWPEHGFKRILALGYASSKTAFAIAGQEDIILSVCEGLPDKAVAELRMLAGTSGNALVISVPPIPKEEIGRAKEQFNFTRIGVMADQNLFPWNDTIPSWYQEALADDSEVGIELLDYTDTETMIEGIQALDYDAFYLLPTARLSEKERRQLYLASSKLHIPLISGAGEKEVELGALAAYKPALTTQLAREIVVSLDQQKAGWMALTTPLVEIHPPPKLSINLSSADNIGLSPSWETLLAAELLGSSSAVVPFPDIKELLELAKRHSPELRASEDAVHVQEATTALSRSHLLPSLDTYLQGSRIDKDRAESLGTPDELQLIGGLQFQQLLWSEEAWAQYDIQKSLLQQSKQQNSSTLDSILSSTTDAYYTIIQADASVRAAQENLASTRAYLGRAKLLKKTGQGSEADVARFEAKTARDSQQLIDAVFSAKNARLELFRVTGFTEEGKHYIVPESNPGGDTWEHFLSEIDNGRKSEKLTAFFLSEVYAYSPDLAALEFFVRASEKERQYRRKAFYSPTISLVAQLERSLYTAGASSPTSIQISGFPEINLQSEDADDTSWLIGINVSFPLFTGTERTAQLHKAEAKVDQATASLRDGRNRIEQVVRQVVSQALAVSRKLDQSRAGERAAQQLLDLTVHSYVQGIATSYELLDAQQDAFLARQQTIDLKAELNILSPRLLRLAGRSEALFSEKK